MGKFGFYIVGTLAFLEFFGDSLIALIVLWQELTAVLPDRGANHRLLSARACVCSGELALGPPGRFLVGFLALTEFFGGSCIMLVVIWRELLGLFQEDHGDRLMHSPSPF